MKKASRVVVSSYIAQIEAVRGAGLGAAARAGTSAVAVSRIAGAPRARRERGARREEHEARRCYMTRRGMRSSDEGWHHHHVRASCAGPHPG
ncbi:hypothetical protein WME91_53805 [Sorangium sp. So ce269]